MQNNNPLNMPTWIGLLGLAIAFGGLIAALIVGSL